MNAIQAIVFDLDGTLIDSAPDVHAATNVVLAEDGRRALDLTEVRSMIGEGAPALIEMAYAATGPALAESEIPAVVKRYVAAYRAAPADHTVVYPGVPEILAGLRRDGFKMGICTNKPHVMTEVVLDALGMSGLFDAVVGREETANPKPDGGHITDTLERMGATGLSAVMVGDSGTDAQAARNAGLPMVAVSWGYPKGRPEDLDADILIDRFTDLPAALGRIANGKTNS